MSLSVRQELDYHQ